MQSKHKKPVKQARPSKQTQSTKPIEETYREHFREQVSPMWFDEESEYSLEQPSPARFVPSVTTYSVSEAPITR
jgi:hypothetical protein